MKAYIAPDCRVVEIPQEMPVVQIVEWLDRSGLEIKSKGKQLWIVPKDSKSRVGDFLAMLQEHPELTNKESWSTMDGYVTHAEDDRYIYEMKVVQK